MQMPTLPPVEGLRFAYALHELPPGRVGFRRWQWELWHGATLVGAGWCLKRSDAFRAMRRRGAEFGHRLFGLRPPPRAQVVARSTPEELKPGATVRVESGPVTFTLAPKPVVADELRLV